MSYTWRKILFDPLAWYLSKKEIRQWILNGATKQSENDYRHLIATTQKYIGRGFYASLRAVQDANEITQLMGIIDQKQPRVIVEIGTYKGGTLFFWCRICRQANLIVSIDLPGGLYGGGYNKKRTKLYQEFVFDKPKTKLVLIQNNSHEQATLEGLQKTLAGQTIDFLYIDGDHTYEGVKQDFEMYSPLVSVGGIIAFHDIVTQTMNSQVSKLWYELKPHYKSEEFVTHGSNKGIGVLYF